VEQFFEVASCKLLHHYCGCRENSVTELHNHGCTCVKFVVNVIQTDKYLSLTRHRRRRKCELSRICP